MNPPTYLAEKYSHERDSHITFDEGPHIYTIDGDSSFTSVTTWNHSHFSHFDADRIINKMMNSRNWKNSKYYGMTSEEIKKQWDDNRDEASTAGTKMHYDIECFYNKMDVVNDSIEYKYFKNFLKSHSNLKPYRTEWMVYDKELKLAGSIDMVYVNSDGTLRIYDWKRCKEIKKDNRWQSGLTSCISHLPDTNFWHYALQLNTYKYMLEKNYGKIVTEMCLVCMHPDNKNNNYIKLQVPDLSEELNNLMALREILIRKEELNNISNKIGNIDKKTELIYKKL